MIHRSEKRDPATGNRTVVIYDTTTMTATTTINDGIAETRPLSVAEVKAFGDRDQARVRADNKAFLSDGRRLQQRLTRLASYQDDPDIVAALARPNSTAPTTQELNRLLKVMLRREERLASTIAALTRLVGGLFDDISDTETQP